MATNQKHKDPWHFSHLGKKYFLKISYILGAVDIPSTNIEDLFIGCTGVEYAEIHNGRLINPNWCVRMKSGKEYRYGTITRKEIVSGLWDLSKCIQLKWTEIVDFYK